jgi:hypothetical protein
MNRMSETPQFLDEWYVRVVQTQRAHYQSAEYFARLKFWLGIPTVVLSTAVGTSVFAALQKQPDFWLQVCVGLASVLAALLASLQTFLGYAERAEKHRIAGAKYGAVGRELEVLRASASVPSEQLINEIRKRLDTLALESPNNPIWIYERAALTQAEVSRSRRVSSATS